MSVAKLHIQWLSLLDISGPFLSVAALERVFPQGLDSLVDGTARELRAAYEEWSAEAARDHRFHWAWVQYVFDALLEWDSGLIATGQAIPEPFKYTAHEHGGETIRPDYILHEAGKPNRPRVLVCVYPVGTPLEKPLHRATWSASPAARCLALLRACGVRLGLVTNGEHWMLVNAPPQGLAGYVSWYAELWSEERLTLRAFCSLLHLRRFFGVADEDTLEALLDESVNDAQEITDQLGLQVRHAVEILVRSLDRANQDSSGALLDGVSEARLYEAALTVMMRLVFLLSAEERGLFLLGDPLYDQSYAVSTLRAQLHESADRLGEEVLERRSDAWARLLATFRLVFSGANHEDLLLPAYGGSLFDPDRFPFLEGRADNLDAALPNIDNRTVLHLLDALQVLQTGGEVRRLSFRALDIEQIGHVYEGLLDHEARRASEVMLGFTGSSEPEIALSDLRGRAEADLHRLLKERTGRSSASTIRNALNRPVDPDRARRLRTLCRGDEALYTAVLPFLNLLRDDEFGYPVLILPGSAFVTAGTERRATGTHYTPRSLTEPIVQHALEPIVYRGMADGLPADQWQLLSARELLALRVCDMAMGSGAFLVQACRYLAERLGEAWEQALTLNPSPSVRSSRGEGLQDSARHGDDEERGARLEVTPELRQRMVEVARHFRKEPTPSEDILWQAIRDRGLEGRKFRRQQPIGAFVVDFFCPSERLVVEVDGGIHTTQQAADADRQALIESAGYRFVRLSAELVESNLAGALELIRAGFLPSPQAQRVESNFAEASELNRAGFLPSPQAQRVESNFAEASELNRAGFLPSPQAQREGEGQGVRVIPRLTIDGDVPSGAPDELLIPDDPDERTALALRLVADRCLYGVDRNPLAVEMAKLSLWLTTLAKGRPFTFLDHALKCGDSLLGVSLDQLRKWSMDPDADETPMFRMRLRERTDEIIALRLQLEAFPVNTVEDQRRKQELHQRTEANLTDLRAAADHLILSYMVEGLNDARRKDLRMRLLDVLMNGRDLAQADVDALRPLFGRYRPFHWELEFPEVFRRALTLNPSPSVRSSRGEGLQEPRRADGAGLQHSPRHTSAEGRQDSPRHTSAEGRQDSPRHTSAEGLQVSPLHADGEGQGVRSGFDAIIGNPPFMGGQHLTGALGVPYRDYLVQVVAGGQRGSADLCAYFFLRAHHALRDGGAFGLIATNTIAQGDSREVGLVQLDRAGATIYRAENDRIWPGAAAVVVDVVHVRRGSWGGTRWLDDVAVPAITPLLDDIVVDGRYLPHRLQANAGQSFQGSIVLGMGFVLEPAEAEALIQRDPRNREVLFPYLNGEDLNTSPEQAPSRWVINFHDWPEEQARTYPEPFAIVERLVKPERTRKNPNGSYALRDPLPQKWWIYAEKRPALYRAIAPLRRVLVVAQTSKTIAFAFVQNGQVYSMMTVVFAFDEARYLACLQSTIHRAWVEQLASTMKQDTRYTPSDVFETFPFPPAGTLHALETIGEAYHETRRQIMLNRQEGLTATYNRFHNPDERAADIHTLRDLHRQMDEAVAAAYGWGDLALEHDFHETAQGARYTISETARREVLRRLLALNFARHEDEQRLGMAGGKKGRKPSPPAPFPQEKRGESASRDDDDPNARLRPGAGEDASRGWSSTADDEGRTQGRLL